MRRRRPEKRTILPDSVYNDLMAAKFINNIMSDGKKSLAEKIFYTSIEKIQNSTKTDDGLAVFKKAINNVCPMLEVKSKRIGGATYQVPVEVLEALTDENRNHPTNIAQAGFKFVVHPTYIVQAGFLFFDPLFVL